LYYDEIQTVLHLSLKAQNIIPMQKTIILLLIGVALFYGCQKEDTSSDVNDNDEIETFSIFKDWVLVAHERTFNETKEFQDEDELYPVTLNFTSADEICGHYDPNTYQGNYLINGNSISFSITDWTDGYASDWFLNYGTNLAYTGLQFEITPGGELKLINEEEGITLIFLSKEEYSNLYVNVDSLYAFNTGVCEPDSMDIQNSLQGTSWALHCVETAEVNTVKEFVPPLTDTTYPITMSLVEGDTLIRGRYGINYYNTKYQETESGFYINGITATEAANVSWDKSYFDYLRFQLTVNNLKDTLKLSNNNNGSHLGAVRL